MNKNDHHALTQSSPTQISKAASLAGRGLRDLQKIQEWELRFPEDRVVGWIEVMGKSIIAHGVIKISKGLRFGLGIERDEGDLSFLSGFPSDIPLYKLDLSNCDQITNDSLACFSHFQQLQEVNLEWCINISDEGLSFISNLPQLQKLNLDGCWDITDKGLACCSNMHKLKELNLSGCGQVTGNGLDYLSNLAELSLLDLSWCKITDEDMPYLCGLTQLQELYLCQCEQISNEGLAYLSYWHQLQILNLSWLKITDAGLTNLSVMSELQELSLCGCDQITDVGLAYLSDLPKLRILHLSGGYDQITDNGLAYIAKLSLLEELYLDYHLITREDLAKLSEYPLIPVRSAEEVHHSPEFEMACKDFSGIDELTYLKAKPLFVQILNSVQESGNAPEIFFNIIFQGFGEKIHPYLEQFAFEEKLDINLGDTKKQQ